VWPFAVRAGHRRSSKACFPFQPPRSECAILPRFAASTGPAGRHSRRANRRIGSARVLYLTLGRLNLQAAIARFLSLLPHLTLLYGHRPASQLVFFVLSFSLCLLSVVVLDLPLLSVVWCAAFLVRILPSQFSSRLGARACIAAGDAHCRGAARKLCSRAALHKLAMQPALVLSRPCSLTSAARTPRPRARSKRAARRRRVVVRCCRLS
jgi:hypothetical protein